MMSALDWGSVVPGLSVPLSDAEQRDLIGWALAHPGEMQLPWCSREECNRLYFLDYDLAPADRGTHRARRSPTHNDGPVPRTET